MKTIKFLGLVALAIAFIVIGGAVFAANPLLVLPESQHVEEGA